MQEETDRRYNFKDVVLRFYHMKMCIRTCTPSEDSDQSADSFSLIRIFTVHSLNSQGCKVSSCVFLGAHASWYIFTSRGSYMFMVATFDTISR